jgi:hypothetical protein
VPERWTAPTAGRPPAEIWRRRWGERRRRVWEERGRRYGGEDPGPGASHLYLAVTRSFTLFLSFLYIILSLSTKECKYEPDLQKNANTNPINKTSLCLI